MHAVIIGGTGHVCIYLIPCIVEAGNEVAVVSRRNRSRYTSHNAWKKAYRVTLIRKVEEATGTIGMKICELGPDNVIQVS